MELILLGAIVMLQAAILATLLFPKPILPKPLDSVDVSPRTPKGLLPGGSYEIIGGLRCEESTMPAGLLVIDVKSTETWIFEVWARTEHGWVQLQPGASYGEFRNVLLSGVRLSQLRLWLALEGLDPDESALRAASGLLFPAALVLSRARPTDLFTAPPSPLRSESPPAEG